MNCPKCGGKTKVSESFREVDEIYRIRKCLICSHRFHTKTTEKISDRKKFYQLKGAYYRESEIVRNGGKE